MYDGIETSNVKVDETKQQIERLNSKVDKVYSAVTYVEKLIRDVSEKLTKTITDFASRENPGKQESTDEYNKIFSLEEYKKLGDKRIASLEVFFADTTLNDKHNKIMEDMDEDTKIYALDRFVKNLLELQEAKAKAK